jgi:hypothetical protein
MSEIELPPFAHAFVLEAPSMAAIRRRCYLVERGHYDALRAENERLRGLLDRVVTEVGRTITPELREAIDAALAGEKS